MKKINSFFKYSVIVGVLIFSILLLCGCSIINSGKMKNITGTYVMTSYSNQQDMMESRKMTLYIVISSDGSGYYAYSDNDTSLYYAPLRARYIPDPEDSGKYSYVEINFNGGSEWLSFGVNSGFGNKQLNYSRMATTGTIFKDDFGMYTISASFERVSADTDLSYVKKTLGEAVLLPYGASRIDGLYEYRETQCTDETFAESGFVDDIAYIYIDFDFAAKKGRAWYMKKSDLVSKTAEFELSSLSGEASVYTTFIDEREISVHMSGNGVYYMTLATVSAVGDTSYNTFAKFDYRGDVNDATIESYVNEAYGRFMPYMPSEPTE